VSQIRERHALSKDRLKEADGVAIRCPVVHVLGGAAREAAVGNGRIAANTSTTVVLLDCFQGVPIDATGVHRLLHSSHPPRTPLHRRATVAVALCCRGEPEATQGLGEVTFPLVVDATTAVGTRSIPLVNLCPAYYVTRSTPTNVLVGPSCVAVATATATTPLGATLVAGVTSSVAAAPRVGAALPVACLIRPVALDLQYGLRIHRVVVQRALLVAAPPASVGNAARIRRHEPIGEVEEEVTSGISCVTVVEGA
jgi:hypothetical protein